MTKLFDTSVELEKRLFYILAFTSVIANTIGFFSNLFFYGLAKDTCFYGVCAILMVIIGTMGSRMKDAKGAAVLILMIINLVEFPVMYYLYGPGRTVYMVLGITGIMIFYRHRIGTVWTILNLIYDVIIMIVYVVFPSSYLEVSPESDLGAAIVSFLIVTVGLVMMIHLLIQQYELQTRKLTEMTEELKMMANRDPLTKLYNRRFLTDYLEPLMEQRETSFAIVLMDLDNFKTINDQYGHVYGDEVLQNFASSLLHAKNEKGIAARYGGEEFMLVIHTTQKSEIDYILKQVQEEFEAFGKASKGIRITFSGGVEFYHNEDRITQLFNAADEKLYCAKAKGKDQIVY